MPEISLIVPVYKIEKYLSACVDSILAQSFTDLELILVDDGSPDGCGELCDGYARKDVRVRVIHQANKGLSCARNAGIDAAAGEYICFIDGDDLIAPDYCSVLLSLLRNTDHAFSVCGVLRFKDGTTPEPETRQDRLSALSSEAYLEAQLDRKTEFGVWNKIFRRSFFETLRFYPGRIHEDVIFAADCLRRRGTVVMTDAQLYFYRQRSTGIVASGAKRCSPDRVFAGEYLAIAARECAPRLYDKCLHYAVSYPWSFVDKIYVDRAFRDDREFLNALRSFLIGNIDSIQKLDSLAPLIKKRMKLFAASGILYGFNAYSRLLRVYLFHILGKDPYTDGYGI